MDKIINLRLLAHPINWGIVWVFLLFAAVAYHMAHDVIAGNDCGCSSTPD